MAFEFDSYEEDLRLFVSRAEYEQGKVVNGKAADGRTWTLRLEDVCDELDDDRLLVWVSVLDTQPRTGKQRVARFAREERKWLVDIAAADWQEGRDVVVTMSDGSTKTVTLTGTVWAPGLADNKRLRVEFSDPTPRPPVEKKEPKPREKRALPTDPASERQMDYLWYLWRQNDGGMTDSFRHVEIPAHPTRQEASNLIELFLDDGFWGG